MTVYPGAIDDDRTIIRIDDNLSEFGTAAINQLRSAVFAIEKELGTTPSGSKSTLDSRISVSLAEDGSLRSSAIEAAGLVSLPIVDSHVAANAGIKESKLALNVSTLDLQAQINAIEIVSTNTANLAAETNADLLAHIEGATLLTDGSTPARHTANQIILDDDPPYIWPGLFDKDGVSRSATQVADALVQINTALTTHENLISLAHPATAITVDGDDWNELPVDAENVQEVLDFLDNQETLSTGLDRATLHSNGIPRNARAERLDLDGYNYELIPVTRVRAYLAEPSQTAPRDAISNGDDIISFVPDDNSDYSFDSLFTQVQVGDEVRISYGGGVGGLFRISSIRFTPGSEWVVRIDGFNLVNRDGDTDGYAYARIDRRRHDIETHGVLAVAAAHANVVPDGACANALDGVIIGNPRGASALGLGLDVGGLNSDHYNLWLRLYPTGDPEEYTNLPPIDVTGNGGTTPGAYSLDSVVEATNNAFRAAGYNFRFIAFQHDGEFGVMLADPWLGASFAIITGEANGTSIDEGMYEKNVVGDATDGADPLGLGASRAIVASPVNNGFTSSIEAVNLSTIIHQPTRGRDYLADGARRDFLKSKEFTTDDYWDATVATTFIDNPNNTVTSTYRIAELLYAEELKPGKSLVIQPVDEGDTDVTGYGRFIIGDVTYNDTDGYTDILVINACHGTGDPLGAVLPADTDVRLYFNEDSVGFNLHNIQGQGEYHRYHEIYVDSAAKTHAVERARMEKQSADVNKINTDLNNWQIRNVSPKMSGYRVDDELRYWLRFYILSYNNTTGEFDGYIGEPSSLASDGVINAGPITRGTKSRPVRFYDNTYVNFIDIEFREFANDPGTVVAASPPQYIDIEIFRSWSTNDAEMRLAGVSHNEQVVGSITDLREFGTLSEENFTDSAISFVEAGERYLHTNGVVRGFQYMGEGEIDGVLTFTGGVGLVNGSFVMTDALACSIPQIKDAASQLDFFICLTQDGTLRAIPENVGSQFFDDTSGDFIESFTFADIVDNHKELLILYVAAVSISSITVNAVQDARRFATNESTNGFSLAVARDGDPEPNDASFHSIEALDLWLGLYDIKEVWAKEVNIENATTIQRRDYAGIRKVIIRGGTWNIDAQLTVRDGVTLDSGSFTITSFNGISLYNDAHIDRSLIYYNPVGDPGYVEGDLVNAGLGFAVHVDSRCSVRRNLFTTSNYLGITQRPPYIYHVYDASELYDVIISDNRFSDTTGGGNNCAICFETGDETTGTDALNVFIERNTCVFGSEDGNHSILFVAHDNDGVGWNFSNTHIRDNRCGIIGYLPHGTKAGFGSPQDKPTGLEISGNVCHAIGMAMATYYDAQYCHGRWQTYPTGNVSIRENVVRGFIWSTGIGNASTMAAVNVESNVVYVEVNEEIEAFFGPSGSGWWSYVRSGIYIDAGLLNTWSYVAGNRVYLLEDASATGGIRAGGNATVIDNYLFTDDGANVGTMIHCTSGAQVVVRGNQLHRNDQTISHYISVNGDAIGMVVDNILDSHLVDTGDSGSWVDAIEDDDNMTKLRNYNHQVSRRYNYRGRGLFRTSLGSQGTPKFQPENPPGTDFILELNAGWSLPVSPVGAWGITIEIAAGGEGGGLEYWLPLTEILPPGTKLVSASADWSVDDAADWDGQSYIDLEIMKEVSPRGWGIGDTEGDKWKSRGEFGTANGGTGSATGTMTVPTEASDPIPVEQGPTLRYDTNIESVSGDDKEIHISWIELVYRW